jgi:hypothetical protein
MTEMNGPQCQRAWTEALTIGKSAARGSCGRNGAIIPAVVPLDFVIDRERRLVISVAYGRLTLADAEQHQTELGADPSFESSFDQIVDCTRVTEFALSATDVRMLAARSVFSGGSRRVGIAPDDLQFAMMRMFETYREIFGGGEVTQVVRTREEALAWYEGHPKKKASA